SSDDDRDDLKFDASDLTDDSSQIIKSMCYTIYNSLFDYWNKLLIVDEETQERAKAKLTHQFKNIATEQTIVSTYTTSSN
ncbi:8532_t:CDS:2, partial [Gigaspora margarita]